MVTESIIAEKYKYLQLLNINKTKLKMVNSGIKDDGIHNMPVL